MFCPQPSLGGRGPSSHIGPDGPLRGSESAKKRTPHIVDLGARGAARSVAPRRLPLKIGAPLFCRFRAAEGAFGP
eukprot:7228122-Alexandrium_andersonii.AAC.1